MKHEDAVAAQRALCDLAETAGELRESQFGKMFQQAQNARYGNGDDGRDWFTTPF